MSTTPNLPPMSGLAEWLRTEADVLLLARQPLDQIQQLNRWADEVEAAIARQQAETAAPSKRHVKDTEPFDAECAKALDRRGDDRGQGLDPYWKWGYRAGWNDRTELAAAPAAPAPPSEPAGRIRTPGFDAATPTGRPRPSKEWYGNMIEQTLDDDFVIGPASQAAPLQGAEDHGQKAYRLSKELTDHLSTQPAPEVAQRPVEGWQPIETAPKGRKVLAGYFNKLGNWRTVMACYYLPQTLEAPDDIFDETSDGYAPEGWYEESESQESILPTDEPPTHWMPLPAAPSQRQQAQPSTGETK